MPVDLKKAVPVTVENFRRAESDMYFSNAVNKDGGFGKFTHYRDPNQDGSVTVQFGGCDGKTPNCLPIIAGWKYLVRLYRPRKEILNGTWRFPEAEPVQDLREAA